MASTINETLAGITNHYEPRSPVPSFHARYLEAYTDFRGHVTSDPLLPEWLRLFFIAAMLDLVRRLFSIILEYINQRCWVTISFDDEDICYSEVCLVSWNLTQLR